MRRIGSPAGWNRQFPDTSKFQEIKEPGNHQFPGIFQEAQTGFEPVNHGVADQQKNPQNPLKLWGILNVSTLFPPYSTKFKPSSRAN